MNIKQERTEFEAWAISEGLIVDRGYYGDKERYASVTTQSAFRGWQAARCTQAENERLHAVLESAVFARDIAMKMTMKADIPYCAEFSAIAQELDAAIANATTAV